MIADCIIFTRFAPDQPGFLDFSYRIKALAKVYRLAVVSAEPLTQPELLIDGVEYVVLPQRAGRLGWFLHMLACARLIRARRPARVVLLHSLLAPLVWLTGRTPVALYWNEHPSRFTASPPSHPVIKRLARKLALRWLFFEAARRATLVMPIGEAHQADLLDHGCHPDRVKLIYMGVDGVFAAAGCAEQSTGDDMPLRLIYAGTVSQARGRDLMLEALKLANRDMTIANLTIVGASPEEIEFCNAYARRLGITDAVQVRGRVDGAQIPALLNNADAGLCLWEDRPWWRFNPPTKLFEYLAAGLPVIASDIRTHTQYISHEYNGLICRYESNSLAQAIQSLAKQRGAIKNMKGRARESSKQYLWSRIEPIFLDAIRSLHNNPSARYAEACQLFEDSLISLEEAQSEFR